MWYNKSFKYRFLVLNVQDNLNAKKLHLEIGCQNILEIDKKKKKVYPDRRNFYTDFGKYVYQAIRSFCCFRIVLEFYY